MLEDVQAGSEVNDEALAENVSVVLFGRGADGTVTEEHNSENVAEVVGRGGKWICNRRTQLGKCTSRNCSER